LTGFTALLSSSATPFRGLRGSSMWLIASHQWHQSITRTLENSPLFARALAPTPEHCSSLALSPFPQIAQTALKMAQIWVSPSAATRLWVMRLHFWCLAHLTESPQAGGTLRTSLTHSQPSTASREGLSNLTLKKDHFAALPSLPTTDFRGLHGSSMQPSAPRHWHQSITRTLENSPLFA
jgi:hypothetical protein